MNKKTMTILLRDAQSELVRTAAAVPDDKLQWQPLDKGRTVLDMLGEVAQTTAYAAQLARTRGEEKMTREIFGRWKEERVGWTRELALEKLAGATDELLAEIENLSEDELAQDVTMTMHSEVTMPLAAWLMLAYRTFVSRFAQINYIQTLYGDFGFH
jgi:hypothetical protein